MKRNHIVFGVLLAVMAAVALTYAFLQLDIQVSKAPVNSSVASSMPTSVVSSESSAALDSMYREVRGTTDKLPLPNMQDSPLTTKHGAEYTIHDVYISKKLPVEFPVREDVTIGYCERTEDGTITNEYSYLFIDMTISNVNYVYDLSWPEPAIYIKDRQYPADRLVTMNVHQEAVGKKNYFQYLISDSLRYTVVYIFEDNVLEQADHFILTISTATPYDSRCTDGQWFYRWSENTDFIDLNPFVFDEQGDNYENDDAD